MKDLDWKILDVLYEKRSITQAAEALFITQSALTKRLKNIENEWGVEIVKRTSKGVLFTEDGRYLAGKATIMLDFLDEIADHFAKKDAPKELVRIGVPNSFARLHMPGLLKEYKKKIDELQFQTVSNSSDVIIKQLIGKDIDMGIVCGDYNFLGEKVKLFDESLFAVTPKGLTLEDVERQPLIEPYLNPLVKSTVDQWWKRHFGSRPHEVHSVPYPDIAIEMAENGLGACLVFGDTWRFNRNKIEVIPIYDDDDGQPISRSVWLMLTDQCFKSQNMLNFVTYAEKYYQLS